MRFRRGCVEIWAAGDGSFDEEDNGNFCVHEINRALGQYVLGIVYKQKMTVHFTVRGNFDILL